ncbi:MAG: FAD-dependent monooxygenase [Gammaproteobacteria bacterium]|nr:FAD-dependent monooxygenase [Gammaproteobacteria bacterium]MDH5302800.1 FAD-dependent monooxygenase [Gammaproteobacteria bacterium]MDH5322360.1 FAD-dependent monooxygenase [Gammaproteobacteria bacterium]
MNILGAGQCGTLLAAMLARHVPRIDLYERGGDPRCGVASAGRSINLALAARGVRALEAAQVMPRVRPLLVPMRGRMVHKLDGSTEFLPYGQRDDEVIFSVSRGQLNQVLLDAAEEHSNVRVHFRHEVRGFDPASGIARIRDHAGGSDIEVGGPALIAADGAGSVVRNAYASTGLIGATEARLQHGYKELTIPAAADGTFQLDPGALHIWPRGEFMLIALPNPGGDFTLTLFLPNEGEQSFATLLTEDAVEALFATNFADAAELIPDLCRSLISNPLGLLGTVRCRRWHDGDKLLLIGDAAHAVVPFHGQGMNLAFEDCVLLEQILGELGPQWQQVFARYESMQLANANAIADMALENYVEMRDTVRDPKFALQKALSFELERRLPDRFIPRYSMVMFHAEIPYRVAKERGALQQALLERLTRNAGRLDQIDLDAAAAIVCAELAPI